MNAFGHRCVFSLPALLACSLPVPAASFKAAPRAVSAPARLPDDCESSHLMCAGGSLHIYRTRVLEDRQPSPGSEARRARWTMPQVRYCLSRVGTVGPEPPSLRSLFREAYSAHAGALFCDAAASVIAACASVLLSLDAARNAEVAWVIALLPVAKASVVGLQTQRSGSSEC